MAPAGTVPTTPDAAAPPAPTETAATSPHSGPPGAAPPAPPLAPALAIVAGNRNLALFLGAVPPETLEALLLFVGCYQVPMYLTPLVMARLYRRSAPAAEAASDPAADAAADRVADPAAGPAGDRAGRR